MQHTGCALADQSDDDIRSDLAGQGVEAPDGWEFLAMPDPDAALRADVDAVRGLRPPPRPASASKGGGTTSTPGRSPRSSARSRSGLRPGRPAWPGRREWEVTAAVGNLGRCRR